MNSESLTKPEIKAMVDGKEFSEVPDDLFIPPDALDILLDSFSGPLDLLLYLIRKQNIDILNIPIVSITKQYLHYIQLMECHRLELAADYLLMAAMLAEIKSRLLLPVTPDAEHEDEDPRMTLVKKLQAYEQIKQAAELLDALPRKERNNFLIRITTEELEKIKIYPDIELSDLITAMSSLLQKEAHFVHHQVSKEIMSVRERMTMVLFQLQQHPTREFSQLFTVAEGRMGLVVTLLAILELARQSLVVIIQTKAFASIHIQAA